MLKKHPLFIAVIIATIFLSACNPVPEQAYVPVETIVAATYAASVAQTEAARPPNTPTPLPPTATRPPGTATPTPTVTFVISTNTPTNTPTFTPEPTATNVTSGSGTLLYACNLLSTSPQGAYRVKANQSFQWVWQIENIGTTRWDPRNVEARFWGGTQLSSSKAFEIREPAKPGQNTSVSIRLTAPKEPGNYSTEWSLRKDIHRFCYAQLEIEVYK